MVDRVSVIITCHNLESFITASIESVLSQDYEGEFEVLVVDDCSTDASAEIIGRYPQVRTIRTGENIGVLMATVLGIRESAGDLIFFLDGDDIWLPGKLRLAVARYEAESGLGLLTHDLEYIDGTGQPIARVSRPSQVMTSLPAADDKLVRDGILLHSDYVWLGSAYSIRRSAIDADGFCDWAAQLPDPFNTYQDWPLAFWAASQRDVSMGYMPSKLLRYRLHGANHSGDARSVGKAVRNFQRSRNTMSAILEIAVRFRLGEPILEATRRKLAYYTCLADLYSGRRYAAIRGFFANLGYLFDSSERPMKEIARFVGIQLLGPRRFVALSKRRRREAR